MSPLRGSRRILFAGFINQLLINPHLSWKYSINSFLLKIVDQHAVFILSTHSQRVSVSNKTVMKQTTIVQIIIS